MPDIDFKAIGQQAVEMVNADATTPVDGVTPASGATLATQSPLVSSTTVLPSTPIAGQVPAVATPTITETTIPVDFGNGRVEQLTPTQIAQKLKDADQNGLRQADYTRKTQDVARQRAEAEQLYLQLQQQQQRTQQLEQQASYILNNPQVALQLAQQHQLANQPIDPNQPMTMGQGQRMAEVIANQFQQIQQQQQGNISSINARASQIVEEKMQVANYAESINSTLSDVYKNNPILTSEPEIDDILRYRVALLQPQDIGEAQAAFKQIGQQMAQNFEQSFNARQQQQLIARQTLASQGIEPPGGAAVQPSVPSYKNDKGGLDWNKLKAAAVSLAGQ